MTDDENDDAADIELAEAMRTAATAARKLYNEFLHAGFTETQSLQLVRSWIHGTAGGHA